MKPILLITVPKSGSVYTSEALRTGFTTPLQQYTISSNIFMSDVLRHQEVLKFTRNQKGLCQNHLPASAYNLAILDGEIDRYVVHVRDPRQATLSWWHHIHKQKESNPNMLYMNDFGNDQYFNRDEFFSLTNHDQIDYLIDTQLLAICQWIDNWISASKSSNRNILFTNHRNLKVNPEEYFKSIANFFEHPIDEFKMPDKPTKGVHHYRKGTSDEFRGHFTKLQLQKSWTRMASNHWENRFTDIFGWEKS